MTDSRTDRQTDMTTYTDAIASNNKKILAQSCKMENDFMVCIIHIKENYFSINKMIRRTNHSQVLWDRYTGDYPDKWGWNKNLDEYYKDESLIFYSSYILQYWYSLWPNERILAEEIFDQDYEYILLLPELWLETLGQTPGTPGKLFFFYFVICCFGQSVWWCNIIYYRSSG